jgi:GNAT superfamily N-acetyltransferase
MDVGGATTRAPWAGARRGDPVPGDAACRTRGYPFDLEQRIAWDDGTTLVVRPIRRDDGARLLAFHHHLSMRSTYLRFFNVHPELSAREVEHFTCVDYQDRLALVVECAGALVAVGRYERTDGSSEAEVAFVVADAFQHHGIATLLLDELAAAAWARGVTVFVATALAENRSMLDVFRNSGFHVTSHRDHETVLVRFSICPDDREPRGRTAHAGARVDRGQPRC